MERVGILINKLQEQLQQQADAKSMLFTVQMLNAELMQSMQQKDGRTPSKVSVVMPYNYSTPVFDGEQKAQPVNEEVVHVEQQNIVEEKKPEPDHEPVEEKVQLIQHEIKQAEPEIKKEHTSWIFDPSEAPTFAHQEKVVYELNESLVTGEASLNDKLKIEKIELAHILHDVPVRDLKKAISINDRHRFIEDLFRGDETMYERSIKTINNFNNFAEAEFWMQRELKLKLAWDTNSQQVKLFDQLVRRRFS